MPVSYLDRRTAEFNAHLPELIRRLGFGDWVLALQDRSVTPAPRP